MDERVLDPSTLPLDDDSPAFEAALTDLELGLYEYDLVRGVQRYTRQAKLIWGFEPHDDVSPERVVALIHPDDRHVLQVAAASLAPDGPGHFAVEHRIVRPDGVVRWIQVRGRTRFAERGDQRHAVASVGTMQDVTEFRTRYAERRAADNRHAFMVSLDERLRGLSSPRQIMFEAARLLAHGLGVQRVGYAEDVGDAATTDIISCFARGVATLRGRVRYEDFGADVLGRLTSGQMVIRAHVAEDPDLEPTQRAAHAAIDIAATVNFPLLKNGRFVAVLFVHSRTPRDWNAHELALGEAVAYRTWDAVERARAQRIVRRAQRELYARGERLRLFIEHAPAAIAMLDAACRYVAVSERYARDAGLGSGELVGRHVDEDVRVAHAPWRTALDRALARETVASEGDAVPGGDGRVEWVKWEVRPWYTKRGTVGGVLLFTETITARKDAAARLERNAETFRRLIEDSPFGIYVVDADLCIAQVSRSARELYAGVEPLIGRDITELATLVDLPWTTPDAIARFRGTLATGEPFNAPRALEPASSRAPPRFDWRIARITMPDGRFGVVCYFYDLRERQEYESRLRRFAARLQLAFEAAGLHPWRADTVANRFEASEGAVALHGLTAADEAWTIEAASAVIHPEDRAGVAGQLAKAARTGTRCRVEYRTVWPDGTVRVIANVALGERDDAGRPTGRIYGAVRDVTAEREAVDRIATSEARLRLALEAARAGAWDWNLDSQRLHWAPETYDLYGRERRSEPLAYAEWCTWVDPRDLAAFEASARDAIAGRTDGLRMEFRVRHPQHGTRWLLAVGQLTRDGRDVPTRVTGLYVDITSQKELEEALHRASQQKDRFIATLSHELRNPLAPIRTAAQVLATAGLSEEQFARASRIVQRQVSTMALLLDDLLDVSRITQGKLAIRTQRATLASIVDASIESARPLLDRKQHRLTVDLPPEPVILDADPLRLAQVLSNLLTNAAKYTDAGGRIALRAAVQGRELVLDVEDDGIGFAPADAPRLFEMFAQIDSAAARAEGGLGIGLALVRGLVELHGGSVSAYSEGPGTGSRFHVRLPLPEDVARAVHAGDAAARSTQAVRVLVADDNPDGADSLALFLALQGHDVRVAYGGVAALEVARAFQPNVAILDLGMPDLAGDAVARQLRLHPGTSTVRLIALTGWGQEEDKRRTAAAGFEAHVTKPADPERLCELIAASPAGTRIAGDRAPGC